MILLWACVAAQWLLYLLALYYFIRSARLLVWRLFRDKAPQDVYDPMVTRVQKLRAWLAPTVSLVILACSATFSVFMQEKVTQPLLILVIAPWLFVATATVVIPTIIRCTPPEKRPAMRPALRSPLRNLGYYVGIITLLLAYYFVLGHMVGLPDDDVDLDRVGWPVKAGFVWVGLVFLFASARVVRTGFGLAAVHPALPAVLSGVLVWECYAINGFPDVPPAIVWLLFLGGPVMVSAIVWWEIHRLRVWHGVTLRGGWAARSLPDQS
ncbi:hypothetical protein AB0J28_00950 [Streptosporangium canum]|uniref:hypothetical protein n=1 Tax=Streptosporangium canum TaxID=324952 RepID=UPI00342C7A87